MAAELRLPETLVRLLTRHLGSLASSDREVSVIPADRDRAYDQLIELLFGWATSVERRILLQRLGWAATAIAATPLLQSIDPEEQSRMIAVRDEPDRLDMQTIEHIEGVLWHCKRQDDVLGPHAALDTVLAQRNLARFLERDCPDWLRPRLLSVLSNASRQAGWLCFDLGDFASAWYYYDEARTLAHEAEDTELGAYVLCNMSHLATWQRKARIGIDHAVAAGNWAKRTDDVLLQAYAADVAARAYAAAGQPDACLRALDAAGAALALAEGAAQPSRFVHFYTASLHASTRGQCYLELGRVDEAVTCTRQSLASFDPIFVRNVAITTVDLSTALVKCNQIEEAARLLGDAGQLASRNRSVRLGTLVRQSRAAMEPWAQISAVRSLDERLASYGLIPSGMT